MYCGNSPDRLWHSNAKSRSAEKARGKPSASYLSAYDLLWWILSSFLSGESSTFGSAAKCRACAVCVGSVFVYPMGDLFICETTTLPAVARSHRHFVPQGHILWPPSTLKDPNGGDFGPPPGALSFRR